MEIIDSKLNLTKINLSKRNGCKHPDIDPKKYYLVKYSDHYIIGKFGEVWYGWNFNYFWSAIAGLQLDHLQEVWEIQ
ncbi:MAG: hypothetical protein WC554_09255 [Clostridia bacterium]